MKFWKRKYSVCKECEVHFEPVNHSEARWADLCQPHRKVVIERDRNRDTVIAWASKNWEKLIEQAEKENAEEAKSLNSAYSNLYALQQAQMSRNIGLTDALGSDSLGALWKIK